MFKLIYDNVIYITYITLHLYYIMNNDVLLFVTSFLLFYIFANSF